MNIPVDLLAKAASEWSPDVDDFDDFSLTPRQEGDRFGKPLEESQMRTLLDSRIPENTRRNTSWSLSVFQAWWKFRQERSYKPLPALGAIHGRVRQHACIFHRRGDKPTWERLSSQHLAQPDVRTSASPS